MTGATAPTGSSGTGTTGSTGLESTGASELVVESPKLTANLRPRNMSELMNPKEEVTSSKSIVDLDTAAKEMLGSEKSSVMQEALIDKLRESGIEVKSSDISIGSKPLNSEVDDLIEKHFVPTKNRAPLGPVVTGHSHSAMLSNTIETALFLENAESIESAETACKGIGKVVDDGLGGNLPGAESVGCNHNPAPEDAAKGHIRLAKGGLKSEFVFSVNAHNHSTNLAIQSILNHLTPQEIVKALRKVSQNKANTKKIGLAGENLTPHEKAIEAVVKSKYSLEMGKSTEEELKVKLDDVSNRVADLSKKVDEATAYVEQLKKV